MLFRSAWTNSVIFVSRGSSIFCTDATHSRHCWRNSRTLGDTGGMSGWRAPCLSAALVPRSVLCVEGMVKALYVLWVVVLLCCGRSDGVTAAGSLYHVTIKVG